MRNEQTTAEDAVLPAAIYCRISRDKDGDSHGVDNQKADCQRLAERLGWDVRAVYVDNDISAYSGKPRPQYRAMLEAVKAGQVRAVIAWHPDRLYRRAADLEEIVNIAETKHLQIATVASGDVDLSTSTGRMTARIVASVAQGEVERTRERVKRAKAQALKDGRRRGGPRPFGFEWVKKDKTLKVRKDEAQVVREATQAIIAGRSLAAVARELNERGVMTSTGKTWTYQRLRDVLIRPTNAGLSHTGRADRGKVEIIGQGNWPPIVDRETWETIYKLLIDPARLSQNSNKSRWLGSGLYSCGVEGCPGMLRPAPHGGTPKTTRARNYLYRCVEQSHLTISADKTDNYVRRFVAEYICVPEVAAALRPDDASLTANRHRRSVLLNSRDQTEVDYDTDKIDARRYAAKVKRINDELAEIEDRLTNGVQQTAAESVLNAANPAAAFLSAPVDVQRGIVRAVGLTITVKSATYRGTQWSSDRIDIAPAEVTASA